MGRPDRIKPHDNPYRQPVAVPFCAGLRGCGPSHRDFARRHVEQSLPVKTFEDLFAELRDRSRTRPTGSATVAALDSGVHALGKKLLEEAGEVWLAAEHESNDALAEEISQLLYWTQVLMVARGISLDDVYRKL